MSGISKLLNCLLMVLLLASCMSRTVKLKVSDTEFDGLVTQSIRFDMNNNSYQWVCYSELEKQKLVGISCQNDTALQLFSGGLVDDEFVFEYPSRFLIKIHPKNMLAYIKMSLFEVLKYDTSAIQINKNSHVTTINDNKRNVKLTIKTL